MNAYELAEQAKEISTTIEALEWVQKVSPLLIQQEKEIERLIGSEPITYGMLTFCKNCGEQNPYYTAPKELSDEEISLVIWESYQSIGNATLTDLCKAILKKASEK
jgi:hypothetical protein